MQDVNFATQVFLPISIAFIMFSIGLDLVWADFKRVVVQPKDFSIGAISQILVLPLVAFLLVSVWPLSPALAVGVMILAACPGGPTSNLMTHFIKGDTALSVTLTAVISLVAVVTLPLIVGFSMGHFMGAAAPDISTQRLVIGVFLTTVPIVIAMGLRRRYPGFADAFGSKAQKASIVLFLVIIAGAIYTERNNIVGYFADAGPVALTLNVTMMVLASVFAMLGGLGARQRIAITLECGVQNGTMAIFVAATLIGNTEMMIPGAIYGLLMYGTVGVYMLMQRRRVKTVSQEA